MENLRKKQKLEALKRMQLLELMPEVIEAFEKQYVVYYSEFFGILYWLSNKPEWVEFVKDFEDKHKALVYHAELSDHVLTNLSTDFIRDYCIENFKSK
jgi:hypothetical protein